MCKVHIHVRKDCLCFCKNSKIQLFPLSPAMLFTCVEASHMSSIAPLGNKVSTAIKNIPYHYQTIKLAVGKTVESLHTWLKTSLEISVVRLVKRVTLVGQSKTSHNLLQRKEINLWDQTAFSPFLNLNLHPTGNLWLHEIIYLWFPWKEALYSFFCSLPILFYMNEKKTIFVSMDV